RSHPLRHGIRQPRASVGPQHRGFAAARLLPRRHTLPAPRLPGLVRRRGHAGGAHRGRGEGVQGPPDRHGDPGLHPCPRQTRAVRPPRRGLSEKAPARLAERRSAGAPADSSSHDHDLVGARAGRIGILAGGGRLPLTIAESVIERGGSVHIVAIEGEADVAIARFPHTWVNWGQVGRMVSTLRKRADALVIVGGVRRPNLWKLRPDWGFLFSLPQILEMMAGGGDDSVLSRVVRFFEAKGITVRGAHEVAPGLLVLGGPAGALSLDRQGLADAELGFAVRAALGALDAGQAVVTEGGRVLAIEGAEGTDAMLRRIADLRGGRAGAAPGGVLAKGPKPGQELRVDMPAIGPRTVEGAAAAGLAGVAVEAGAVLLLDRTEAIAEADACGIAIE